MKWFEKHTTDRNDLASKLIKRKLGLAGYGIYESLQQIVAENMEGDDVAEWGLVAKQWTIETLADEIGCSVDEFRQFVAFCDDQLILEKKDGRLFMPLMLERMNEYAKRQYRKTQKKQKTSDNSDNTDKPASQHNTVQHITSQHKELNTGDTRPDSTMGAILMKRLESIPVASNGISKSWQEKAFRYADDLGIKLSENDKPRWLRVFKQADGGRKVGNLERAYSYIRDHPNKMENSHKLNLFFKIYENGLQEKTI